MSQPQTPANETSWHQLELLLKQARESLQCSDYRKMEGTLQAAGQLVARLTAADPPPLPAAQKDRLVNAYHQLTLMGATHQQATQKQLRQIREGRRTLAAYARQA